VSAQVGVDQVIDHGGRVGLVGAGGAKDRRGRSAQVLWGKYQHRRLLLSPIRRSSSLP
jgi:hypothetical protein